MTGLLLRPLLINTLWPFVVKRQRHCAESKCIFKQALSNCTSHPQHRKQLSGSSLLPVLHFNIHTKQDIAKSIKRG